MYICKNCWFSSFHKLWKCPNCWSFSSFDWEQKVSKTSNYNIYELKESEFKRVFWKWLVAWWLYLLAWEPGIWKSTFMLHILDQVNVKKAYFSSEETVFQIKERMNRINVYNIDVYNMYYIEDALEKAWDYDLVVFDSLQLFWSNEWYLAWNSQTVRYISEKLLQFSKKYNKIVFILWHVTKIWDIAWPKYLEHIVDVVLYLEWDKYSNLRFLKIYKNRFWNSDEVWIFEMTEKWLMPFYNYNEKIFSYLNENHVLAVWLNGKRAFLIPIEVLLVKTRYKYPKRVVSWISQLRLDIIVAILEKYLNLKLSNYDIFVNIPFWFKFNDVWLDLALAFWIYWQYNNIVYKNKVFIWELSLHWQVLPSSFHEKRIKEISWRLEVIDYNKIFFIKDIKNVY